jgi:hypothetical protein
MKENNPFVVGAIGVGQAGTNIAQTFMQVVNTDYNFLGAINLSNDDLTQATLVPTKNRLHLDKNMYGAGKKRNISKTLLMEKIDDVFVFFRGIFESKKCNIIFVFFSTSGGTGSGIGPSLTAILESDVLADIKPNRCIVIGVPLIGDLAEGRDLLANTLSCLKEVDNLVKNKKARFMPIYNQSHSEIKNDINKWKIINDEAVRLIDRYLFINYKSRYSNLDPEDRFTLLMTPGLHSLLTFDPKDAVTTVQSPFIIPDGANIQRMGIELPNEFSEKRFELIKSLGANVTEPNFVGLYDKDVAEDDLPASQMPIVHFAGFNNLANFVQPYQVQITRLDSVDTTGATVNKDGSGFDNVEDNINKITKKNEMARVKEINELFKDLI